MQTFNSDVTQCLSVSEHSFSTQHCFYYRHTLSSCSDLSALSFPLVIHFLSSRLPHISPLVSHLFSFCFSPVPVSSLAPVPLFFLLSELLLKNANLVLNTAQMNI